MSVRAEITQQPGLAELLSREEEAPDEEVALAIEAFLATQGVAGTPVEEGILEAIDRRSDAAAEGIGLLDWIGRRLDLEQHRVVGSQELPVELEAYWLTLPGVAEARITVTSSASSSDETSASVTIAGIGGGPSVTIDLKEQTSFEGSTTERVSLSAMGLFDEIRVTRSTFAGDEVVATYPRLRAVDQSNLQWTRRPSTAPDPTSLGSVVEAMSFDATASDGLTTHTLTAEQGTSWEFGVDLSLEKLGLTTKVSSKTTYKHAVEYEYKLPGGHDYRATRYEQFPAYLWTVVQ